MLMNSLSFLIQQATSRLKAAGVATAALDARVLLSYVTSYSTEELLLKREQALSLSIARKFFKLVERRACNEPIAYIVGHKEFYGIDFKVNKNVLIPRPDSEALIELAQSYFKLWSKKEDGLPRCARDDGRREISTSRHCEERSFAAIHLPQTQKGITMLDLGTGSGCLILTLLSILPQAEGIGVDISSKALSIAKQNAVLLKLNERVRFIKSDWSRLRLKNKFDLVISNPPYIKHKVIESLQEDVKGYEPTLALDGGEDGLDCYRSIFLNLRQYLKGDGVCVVEIGVGQLRSISALAKSCGFKLDKRKKDLAGKIRAVSYIVKA
jgi:release factor glutamine methyltransferase